jgi:hypothetical protein
MSAIIIVKEQISWSYDVSDPPTIRSVDVSAYTTQEDAVKGLHMFMNLQLKEDKDRPTSVYKREVVYDKGDRAKIRIYYHPSKRELKQNPECPDHIREILYTTDVIGLNVGSDRNYEL